MSTEYGAISDPINFLDAEVVKYDGTVVMTSQEPGLLWALRGGGGGVGVVTKVLLRAHPYPTDIWSGMVLVPRKLLPQLVDKMYAFNHSVPHPKVNYFAYLLPKKLLATVLESDEPGAEDSVVFHVYDALGEKHGRDVFQWLLQMPGAIDRTRVTNMKGTLETQRNAAALRGTMRTLYAPMAVADMDQRVITRAIEFYYKIRQLDESTHIMSAVIFEFLSFRSTIGGTSEVAWPRSNGLNHLLLFIFSGPGDGPQGQEKILRQLSEDAPRHVLGSKAGDAEINPAGLEPDYHDVKGVSRNASLDPDLELSYWND
ncbi:FAD binding domain-containing protein [Colletotrichum higginsianum IMI 349063]|uniref:FAD binding domain-containing protein n=1 Tax=Colletotrichum higginsianum (strain IMI 349063) TaxID=759273 RepID=A0A1B7Y4K1_COLHI|nr:FAD binding domain-containing protein [Colletotrichum higginsianum IMI 349063]OBR06962.1 FAD binding domain-containing protein [Colletotrichum higginsianum IMI 349063]